MSEWQPIETAPKDGKRIALCVFTPELLADEKAAVLMIGHAVRNCLLEGSTVYAKIEDQAAAPTARFTDSQVHEAFGLPDPQDARIAAMEKALRFYASANFYVLHDAEGEYHDDGPAVARNALGLT